MPPLDTFRFPLSFPLADRDAVEGLVWMEEPAGIEESETADELTFRVYFTSYDAALGARENIVATGMHCGEVETVVPQDWNAKWRETMEPARLTDTVWVSPEWLPPAMKSGDTWIKIEPKMAFGTGHHETTRLAAKAVLAEKVDGGLLLDVGTGSGVLCFAAKLAGYEGALGVEIDMDCAENLGENMVLNGEFASGVLCAIGTLDSIKTVSSFRCIVMNMIRTESDPCMDYAEQMLLPTGAIVRSGILVSEKDLVVSSMAARGFGRVVESAEGEWWCGVFTRG